jgi:hypothetical protein
MKDPFPWEIFRVFVDILDALGNTRLYLCFQVQSPFGLVIAR